MLYVARSKLVVGAVAFTLSAAPIRPLQAQGDPRLIHAPAAWMTGAWADVPTGEAACDCEADPRAGTPWLAGCNNASQWAPTPVTGQLEERPNGWLIVGFTATVTAASVALTTQMVTNVFGSEHEHPVWKGAGVGAILGVGLGVVICAYHGGCNWPPFSDEAEVSWAATTGRARALSLNPAPLTPLVIAHSEMGRNTHARARSSCVGIAPGAIGSPGQVRVTLRVHEWGGR
jgi:hypothetical protein